EAVHERAVALGRGALPGQVQAAAVGGGHHAAVAGFVGDGERAARVVVAVLGGAVERQLGGALGMVGGDAPLAGRAVAPPDLADAGPLAVAPGGAAVAVAQVGQLHRLAVERGGVGEHAVAPVGVHGGVAAVLGLGPDQGGRGVGAPVDPAHA